MFIQLQFSFINVSVKGMDGKGEINECGGKSKVNIREKK